MPKPSSCFVCQSCGSVHGKWAGRCDSCGEWNTLVEEVTSQHTKPVRKGGKKTRGIDFVDLGGVSADVPRLRISSIDSIEADDNLMLAIASEPRLMPHLHLSLQHGDDLILKRMKRRHLRDDAIRFTEEARRLLHKHRIERLVIVDHEGKCLGLLTVKDMDKAAVNPNAAKDAAGRLRVAAASTVGVKVLGSSPWIRSLGRVSLVCCTATVPLARTMS